MNNLGIGAAAAAGAVTLLASALPVNADLVQLRDGPAGEFANGQPGGPLLIGTGSTLNGTFSDGSDGPLYIGTFDLEADYGAGFQTLLTYCIEPTQNFTFGYNPPDTVGVTYQTAPLAGGGITDTEAGYIEILWANAFDTSITSQVNAAAFQSVIWEFTQDAVIDLNDGVFRLNDGFDEHTGSVHELAQSWIDNILSGEWTESVDLVALTNPDSQDFIALVIPAPPAAALLLMPALFAARRRRSC